MHLMLAWYKTKENASIQNKSHKREKASVVKSGIKKKSHRPKRLMGNFKHRLMVNFKLEIATHCQGKQHWKKKQYTWTGTVT